MKSIGVAPRAIALSLSIALGLPGPASALRVQSGLESRSESSLNAALLEGTPAGLEESVDQIAQRILRGERVEGMALKEVQKVITHLGKQEPETPYVLTDVWPVRIDSRGRYWAFLYTGWNGGVIRRKDPSDTDTIKRYAKDLFEGISPSLKALPPVFYEQYRERFKQVEAGARLDEAEGRILLILSPFDAPLLNKFLEFTTRIFKSHSARRPSSRYALQRKSQEGTNVFYVERYPSKLPPLPKSTATGLKEDHHQQIEMVAYSAASFKEREKLAGEWAEFARQTRQRLEEFYGQNWERGTRISSRGRAALRQLRWLVAMWIPKVQKDVESGNLMGTKFGTGMALGSVQRARGYAQKVVESTPLVEHQEMVLLLENGTASSFLEYLNELEKSLEDWDRRFEGFRAGLEEVRTTNQGRMDVLTFAQKATATSVRVVIGPSAFDEVPDLRQAVEVFSRAGLEERFILLPEESLPEAELTERLIDRAAEAFAVPDLSIIAYAGLEDRSMRRFEGMARMAGVPFQRRQPFALRPLVRQILLDLGVPEATATDEAAGRLLWFAGLEELA